MNIITLLNRRDAASNVSGAERTDLFGLKNLTVIGKKMLLLAFFLLTTVAAQAQTYNDADTTAMNAIIREHPETGMTEWSGSTQPSDWDGIVAWSDASDKRIVALKLDNKNLTGALDVSGLTALTSLNCQNNQLTALDVLQCKELDTLHCYNNRMTALDVSDLTKLLYLDCKYEIVMSSSRTMAAAARNDITLRSAEPYNRLETLNLSGCTALKRLECSGNQLTALDVSGLTALTSLNCQNNQLTELDVSGCTVLETLRCNDNLLDELTLSPSIKSLDCYQNRLTALDLSSCTTLSSVNCQYNNMGSDAAAAVIGFSGSWDGSSFIFSPQHAADFKAVIDLVDVPKTVAVGATLALTGTVVPSDATNQTVDWSIVNDNSTQTNISGNTLTASSTGTVEILATITNGSAESVNYTKSFQIQVKIAQTAPSAPTYTAGKTSTSITLDVISGAEYRYAGGVWQDSPVFTGLTPDTQYSFTARIKETETHAASPESAELQETTDPLGDDDCISEAKTAIENETYTGRQAVISDIATAKTFVDSIIDALNLNGVTATVVDGVFTPAVAGISTNPNGTDGSYTFTVNLNKGTGTQQTTESRTLTITAAPYLTVEAIADQTYTGNAIEPAITVKDGSTTLTLTTDYTVEYADNTDAGTATVNVTGAGNYAGSTGSATFTIAKATLDGTVTIDGTLEYGETLTANTSGLTSSPTIADKGTLSYQWKRDGTVIPGATNGDYTAIDEDIEKTLSVTVTAANCDGDVPATATAAIAKATQTAPAIPEVERQTSTSITLDIITGAEYSHDNGANWQDEELFDGLTPNTDYTFIARLKETATHAASAESGELLATTDKAALGGTVTIDGTPEYGATLTANTSGLTSSPTIADLGTLSYQWKRGGTAITDATGATYTAVAEDIARTLTVTVTAANCTGEKTETVTITKASQAAPAIPEVESQTPTSVTLKVITGAEYRRDAEAWQDSPAFTGLTPNTDYTFIARLKVTATHAASPESAVLQVTTDPLPTCNIIIGTLTNGTVVPSKSPCEKDTTVTLTVTPAAGYELDAISAYKTGSATTTIILSGSGNTRTFVMPDYDVTVNATFKQTQATLDSISIAAAKTLVEAATYGGAQANISNAATAKTRVTTIIGALNLNGVTAEVIDSVFTAAIAGTPDSPNGTNGSYTFTVRLTKGGAAPQTTVLRTLTITATPAFLIDPIADQTYSGDLKRPAVTVKYGTTALVLNIDYTVTYASHMNVGTATVMVTGMGTYAGKTLSATFTIVPKPQSITFNPADTIYLINGEYALRASTEDNIAVKFRIIGVSAAVTISNNILKPLQEGLVRVAAYIDDNNYVATEVERLIVMSSSTTGIDRVTSASSLKVWPNPVVRGGTARLEYDAPDNTEVRIYTLQGTLISIHRLQNGQATLTFPPSAGMYIVRAGDATVKMTVR